MKQATRPDRPTPMEAIAAAGYLLGLVLVAVGMIFGLPLLLLVVAQR